MNTFSEEDIVLSSEIVSTPVWSTGVQTITRDELYTSDDQLASLSSDYYTDYYAGGKGETLGEVQFALTFADSLGSGSKPYNEGVIGQTPARTMYGQYQNMVLGDEEADFSFGSTMALGDDLITTSSCFWAISVDRARYKGTLGTGTIVLKFGASEEDPNLILCDNSTEQSVKQYCAAGRVCDLVLAMPVTDGITEMYKPLKDATTHESYLDSGSYGYLLPDIGVILIDSRKALEKMYSAEELERLGFEDGHPVAEDKQDMTVVTDSVFMDRFISLTLQAQETVTSNYIFVRAKNAEFNYSMNPSMVRDNGELIHSIMQESPETYITTIGLYNSTGDLVAVARLSRPLAKNFTKEALFRVKLDY